MANIRTVTVDDDKVEQAQKNKQGRQPGMREDARRIGVPDDGELSPQTYLVKRAAFINGAMVQEGQIVKLPDGVKPGKFLEPVRVVQRRKSEGNPPEAPVDDDAQDKPKAEKPPTANAPALDDIPDKPIPANAPRTGAAAKLKSGKHETGGDDDTGI